MLLPLLSARLEAPPIVRALDIPTRRDQRQNRRLPQSKPSGAAVVTPGSYANCISWCRSDASTITLNGSNVSAWADMTSNVRGYQQASALRQPAYVSSGGIGGLPYISFVGSTTNELRWVANGFASVIALAWAVLRPQWPGSGPGASLWYFLGVGNVSAAALTTVASSVGASTLQIQFSNTGASGGETPAALNEGQGYVVDWASDNIGASNGGKVNNATAFGDVTPDATAFDGVPFNLGDTQTLTLSANFELYEIALYSSLSGLSTIRSQNLAYAQARYGGGI